MLPLVNNALTIWHNSSSSDYRKQGGLEAALRSDPRFMAGYKVQSNSKPNSSNAPKQDNSGTSEGNRGYDSKPSGIFSGVAVNSYFDRIYPDSSRCGNADGRLLGNSEMGLGARGSESATNANFPFMSGEQLEEFITKSLQKFDEQGKNITEYIRNLADEQLESFSPSRMYKAFSDLESEVKEMLNKMHVIYVGIMDKLGSLDVGGSYFDSGKIKDLYLNFIMSSKYGLDLLTSAGYEVSNAIRYGNSGSKAILDDNTFDVIWHKEDKSYMPIKDYIADIKKNLDKYANQIHDCIAAIKEGFEESLEDYIQQFPAKENILSNQRAPKLRHGIREYAEVSASISPGFENGGAGRIVDFFL